MSKSCLVVDDSKVIRKVARHILESMSFAVEEAADGQEALTATFDLDEIARLRASWGLFRDRRVDIYDPVMTLDGQHPSA